MTGNTLDKAVTNKPRTKVEYGYIFEIDLGTPNELFMPWGFFEDENGVIHKGNGPRYHIKTLNGGHKIIHVERTVTHTAWKESKP